ncbi:MAG: GlsB/YeaQ/YmgE family stress response membrane protein [Solirubrobacterales bacterium]
MYILWVILFGLVAGFLARALMPGKQNLSIIVTILLGIGGAFVGFFLFTELLGIGDSDKFDLGSGIGAVIGSMILLFIYDKVAGGKAPAT